MAIHATKKRLISINPL